LTRTFYPTNTKTNPAGATSSFNKLWDIPSSGVLLETTGLRTLVRPDLDAYMTVSAVFSIMGQRRDPLMFVMSINLSLGPRPSGSFASRIEKEMCFAEMMGLPRGRF
jgi:hypothetical protein